MSLLSLLPILIVFSGTYLLFKLKFFFIKHPIRTLKFTFNDQNKKKRLLSLMLALAGTLGVGNISGVAIGLAIGGAGSVFWLLFSSLFSSCIKYAEVYVSYKFGGIGMISVIKSSFKHCGLFLAYIYAVIVVILSFSMGSIFQARAIAESASNTSNFNVRLLGAMITFLIAAVCIFGTERIKGAVAFIIPVATIVYTGMCLFVIFANSDRLIGVVLKVLRSAFSFKSASGGILGFIVSSGMKEGFARGLLSNEAGAGTSSFSHTSHIEQANSMSSNTKKHQELAVCEHEDSQNSHTDKDCKVAGIFGILEVVFDTLLLCPLTAFTILLGYDGGEFNGSVFALSDIFEKHIGEIAPHLLLYSIIFFAISTTLCWYYYGKTALSFVSKGKFTFCYSTLFFFSFYIAMQAEIPHILFITDTSLFILSVISLSSVIKNRALLKF